MSSIPWYILFGVHILLNNKTNKYVYFLFQDHDMDILKREVEHDDVRMALAFWCKMNKFQGIIYPTENDYEAAKGDEVEIKKQARILAETRIRSKKCQAVGIYDENYEKESHSSLGDNKDERTNYNAAEFEAYHDIDSRKAEEKVLKFRVTCIRNGTHCFGSQDAAYHVGGTLQDMFHWIVDLKFYDLEIMLNIREGKILYVSVCTLHMCFSHNL
jgi:tRNA(Ser,Leu) C12 N-acetylase TAN1